MRPGQVPFFPFHTAIRAHPKTVKVNPAMERQLLAFGPFFTFIALIYCYHLHRRGPRKDDLSSCEGELKERQQQIEVCDYTEHLSHRCRLCPPYQLKAVSMLPCLVLGKQESAPLTCHPRVLRARPQARRYQQRKKKNSKGHERRRRNYAQLVEAPSLVHQPRPVTTRSKLPGVGPVSQDVNRILGSAVFVPMAVKSMRIWISARGMRKDGLQGDPRR
jgi:hypothetical protein